MSKERVSTKKGRKNCGSRGRWTRRGATKSLQNARDNGSKIKNNARSTLSSKRCELVQNEQTKWKDTGKKWKREQGTERQN
jgi:hypothetical protein